MQAVKLTFSFIAFVVFGLFFALAFSPQAFADNTYGPYDATVKRVIDGDTVEVNVHLWPGLTKEVDVRIVGVNTPEKRTSRACEKRLGLKATAFVETLLPQGALVRLVNIDPSKTKFAGRVSGDLLVDGELLSARLLAGGHAKPYFGGKREPWCAE